MKPMVLQPLPLLINQIMKSFQLLTQLDILPLLLPQLIQTQKLHLSQHTMMMVNLHLQSHQQTKMETLLQFILMKLTQLHTHSPQPISRDTQFLPQLMKMILLLISQLLTQVEKN